MPQQLTLLEAPAEPETAPRAPKGGWLAEPLSKAEQRQFGRFYAANDGLVRMFARRLLAKYGHCIRAEDVNHCCDVAFLKACRAHDPARGTFSTIYWKFAQGEVRHYIRDANWEIQAPGRVRERGVKARQLMEAGLSRVQVCRELNCDADDLRLALVATTGIEHDIREFDLHLCPRPTPMEALEDAES